MKFVFRFLFLFLLGASVPFLLYHIGAVAAIFMAFVLVGLTLSVWELNKGGPGGFR